MLKVLNELDKKAVTFLIIFLNVIFLGTVISVIYGIYYGYIVTEAPLLTFHNIRITFEYLIISLCECVGGALLLDYILRKSN